MRARARARDETYRGGVDGESHGGAHRRASLEALRRASAELHLESRHARRIGSVHAQVAHSRIHSWRSFAREVFATDDGTRARAVVVVACVVAACDARARMRHKNSPHHAPPPQSRAPHRDRAPRARTRSRSIPATPTARAVEKSTHVRASHRARARARTIKRERMRTLAVALADMDVVKIADMASERALRRVTRARGIHHRRRRRPRACAPRNACINGR